MGTVRRYGNEPASSTSTCVASSVARRRERRDKAATAAAKTIATAKETTAAAATATAAQNKRKREQRGSKGPNAVHDKLNGLYGLSRLYGPRATAAAASVGCVLRAARRCDWRLALALALVLRSRVLAALYIAAYTQRLFGH